MSKINKIIFCFLVMGLCAGCGGNDSKAVYSSNSETENMSFLETESSEVAKEYVYVQITGAVNAPGVYKVEAGLRVFEVLSYAGDIREDGDKNAINLAKPVEDEMQIYVPTFEEVEKSNETYYWEESAVESDGCVNINTATKEELMTLPGIGESRAESIIAYREENGTFGDISEIMNVSGIKDAAFNKIKEKIKV